MSVRNEIKEYQIKIEIKVYQIYINSINLNDYENIKISYVGSADFRKQCSVCGTG